MAKYRCEYRYTIPYGQPRHTWIVIGAKGGLHLHITDIVEDKPVERYSGGIEMHWRYPPPSMADQAPTHDFCQILHCPCWHDGSSIAVTEYWIPFWQTSPNNHERMFEALAFELQTHCETVE